MNAEASVAEALAAAVHLGRVHADQPRLAPAGQLDGVAVDHPGHAYLPRVAGHRRAGHVAQLLATAQPSGGEANRQRGQDQTRGDEVAGPQLSGARAKFTENARHQTTTVS